MIKTVCYVKQLRVLALLSRPEGSSHSSQPAQLEHDIVMIKSEYRMVPCNRFGDGLEGYQRIQGTPRPSNTQSTVVWDSMKSGSFGDAYKATSKACMCSCVGLGRLAKF